MEGNFAPPNSGGLFAGIRRGFRGPGVWRVRTERVSALQSSVRATGLAEDRTCTSYL